MALEDVTPDMKRLLYLIYKFSKTATTRDESEEWIKKIPLMAIINKGVQAGTFVTYDVSPQLVDYMGTTRYASMSKEGEDDVADLREEGLVERLKLATSHHVYVSAYRITPAGMDYVKGIEKKHKDAIDRLLNCRKCGGEADIIAEEDAPYLLCKKCGDRVRVEIFDIEDVPYVSSPVAMAIWLPPD
jgi:hypothetical protein